MNGFLNRIQRTFRIINVVLIYCMVVVPVSGSTAWSAPTPVDEQEALSVQEKETLVQQGVDQYRQGDHEQAQKNLERAREVFPENYAAPYYLGLIYLKKGQRRAAISQWRQYVEMDSGSENALRIRKNLTVLLREQARESARMAMASEAALIRLPADDNTVAISSFKNLGSANIQPLGKGMAALLIHDISLVPGLSVVERVQLQALLEEMKLGTSGLVTAESSSKVGKLLKAKHVTSGSLADLEEENLQIASAVVDADQKAATSTQEAQGELKKFYDLEKEIACQIVEDLGKDCDKAPAAFHKIHTKSLAALIFFGVGLSYLDQESYDQARESFQKALDEDSSFELAQQALLDTPVPEMQYMSEAGGAGAVAAGLGTTDEMIAMAGTHGVSAEMAGTAVAKAGGLSPDAAGGVGIVPVIGVVAGVATVAGVAVAAGDSSSSSSSGGGTPVDTGGGVTPTGQCNSQQIAGGDTADQRNIEMGQNAGSFNFDYETYSIRDQIIVSYEGNQLFDTGCVGASNSVALSYSGTSTQIRVEVIPNCSGGTSGTAWNYTASCP
jgi:Tfp pilus assembly protein PilF